LRGRLPFERGEGALREAFAIGGVDVAGGDARVKPRVMEEDRAEEKFAVDLQPAVGRHPLGDQELSDRVALHRVVGAAGRLPEGCEAGALGVGGGEVVGSRDDRASMSVDRCAARSDL
jgi:hypothetical protein